MQKFPQFSSPHVHIQSLDSASTPEAFIKRELELGSVSISVTDHGTLVACQETYKLARKNKLIPIMGLEGYFRDDNCPILKAEGFTPNEEGKLRNYWNYGHITIHFKDQDAFRVGTRLLSLAPAERHGSEAKPLFNWENIEELAAANTTMTTGCLIGIIGRHLLQNNRPDIAEKYLQRLIALTRPGQLLIELFPHICSHNYVNAVFTSLKGLDPLKYHKGKWFRTNIGEIRANELAEEFKKVGNKHTHLLAVKDYSTWVEREPAEIVSVDHTDGEVQNECRPWAPNGDVQLGVNKFLLEMSQRYKIPAIISDDAHHAYPEEKIIQDVRLAQSGNLRFVGSYHRQSSDEAWDYFRQQMDMGESKFRSLIDTSHEWAQGFKDFKFESKPELPTKFWEERYPSVGAKTSLDYAMHLIKKNGRMDWKNEAMVARLKEEIKLFYQNGTIDLIPYFFIDEEVCELYNSKGEITGVGRGSAAGVLFSYLIGITHADPLRFGLSLDRFLTLDRIRSGKFPDVDQDLPHRELLTDPEVGWLHTRFGDHAAQISTTTTLRLSSAVLDVARFKLGKVPPDIAELSKHFERPPQGVEDINFIKGYEDSGVMIQGSIERDVALKEYISRYPEHWEIVRKSLGLGRATGRHASGFLIANRPIHEFIPTMLVGGVRCTQFTAGGVEAAGGIKMDFLNIAILNDISAAIKLVQKRSGIPIKDEGETIDGKWVPKVRILPLKDGVLADIWDLPEDQAVFEDVALSKTETVFQYNTPAAQQWLKQFSHIKPDGRYIIDSIESMAVFTALDRPGPLDAYVSHPDDPDSKHNMLVEYARRARGLAQSPDVVEAFNDLFPETYGVLTFQEQLQRAYQTLTGCTGAEAEAFRSNVAKKEKEKVLAAYPNFIEKAAGPLGGKKNAEASWAFFNSWSEYGFNKAHAISYAITGYACAYLKHHYPLEWWCGVLSNASKDEIGSKFWPYAKHLIDLPDITQMSQAFTIVGDRLQAPVSLLQNVGEKAQAELVELAPFSSIRDLVNKIDKKKEDGTALKAVKKTIKTVADDGSTQEVIQEQEKVVKGRSAIHKGIIYKLITSGSADKLFDPSLSTLDKLEEYERAVFDLENEKRAAIGKKPKKAQAPLDPKYSNLNQFTAYQLKKEILPVYSDSLLDAIPASGVGCIRNNVGNLRFWMDGEYVPVADLEEIERLEQATSIREGGVKRAIVVYVLGTRLFKYPKEIQDKEALSISFELEGRVFDMVRWPEKQSGRLDYMYKDMVKSGLVGAIATIIVSKYKVSSKFSIDYMEIIQEPFVDKKEEEK